jgi:hypothetical protein
MEYTAAIQRKSQAWLLALDMAVKCKVPGFVWCHEVASMNDYGCHLTQLAFQSGRYNVEDPSGVYQ